MIPVLDWPLVGAWITAVFSLLSPVLAVVVGVTLAVYIYRSVFAAVSQAGEGGRVDDSEDEED